MDKAAKKKKNAILLNKFYVDKFNNEFLKNYSFYIKINQNLNPIHKKVFAYKKKFKPLNFFNLSLPNHHTLPHFYGSKIL